MSAGFRDLEYFPESESYYLVMSCEKHGLVNGTETDKVKSPRRIAAVTLRRFLSCVSTNHR